MTESMMKNARSWKPVTTGLITSLSLVLAACGPTEEEPEIVDVDPYETVSQEPPEIEGSSPEREIRPDEEVFDVVPDEPLGDAAIIRYAEAVILPVDGSGVSGKLELKEESGTLFINGEITGLKEGEHGFHVHQNNDCSGPGASSAGGHFAPDGDPHGSPLDAITNRHAGDLGNIVANENGVAEVMLESKQLNLGTGRYSIINRAIVVHADPDDFISQPSGNSGARVGCAVVNIIPEAAYGY